MNWDEHYQKGELFWDKGAPAPAMKQFWSAMRSADARAESGCECCGESYEVGAKARVDRFGPHMCVMFGLRSLRGERALGSNLRSVVPTGLG